MLITSAAITDLIYWPQLNNNHFNANLCAFSYPVSVTIWQYILPTCVCVCGCGWASICVPSATPHILRISIHLVSFTRKLHLCNPCMYLFLSLCLSLSHSLSLLLDSFTCISKVYWFYILFSLRLCIYNNNCASLIRRLYLYFGILHLYKLLIRCEHIHN